MPGTVGELPTRYNWPFALARRFRLARKPFREPLIDLAFSKAPPSHKWKHCATNFGDISSLRETLVVFCIRNPASWLLALHRKPYHAKSNVPSNFSEFLNMNWTPVGRENLAKTSLKPTELYNEKIRSYQKLINKLDAESIKWTLINFEDFAVDQEAAFAALRPHLPHSQGEFIPIRRSTKEQGKDLEFYKSYYGNELWKQEIERADVRTIKDSIDWSHASFFGYDENSI